MTVSAINVRNQFRGKVREVIEGPVVSEVDVETAGGLKRPCPVEFFRFERQVVPIP